MQRIKDTYLETIQSQVSLAEKTILEIGCGTGTRTAALSKVAMHVTAIDPSEENVEQAMSSLSGSGNVELLVASAEALPFEDERFDIVFFTLSFHHVPVELMKAALDEAVRVVRAGGHIVFLEPAFCGSFFESEILFDACDGDERLAKAQAYCAMLSHRGMREVCELWDETVFTFSSAEDFIGAMNPKRGSDQLEAFLREHQFTLRALRRINIARPL